MPSLRVDSPDRPQYQVRVERDPFNIGRSADSDLSIPSLSLSRNHARLTRRGEAWWLQDSGSRNGTFLNRKPVTEPLPVEDGDEIRVGDIRLYFESGPRSQVELVAQPFAGGSDTYTLKGDDISFRRYAEASKSDSLRLPGEAGIWPALNEAAATLITYYPLDQLLEVVMDIVFRAVPAQRGALMLRRADSAEGLETRVVRTPEGGAALAISTTIVRQVIDEQKAVLTLDAMTDDRFERAQSIRIQGIRSVLCVPLWNEREVIGLIYVDNLLADRSFSQSDLRLLGLIANMAAVKVENARLMLAQLERERLASQLQVAAQIQRRLLPQANPIVPGYEVHGESRSCYEIGGDYYDFLWQGGDRLCLVIADVSGKGVGAALLMSAFQASLRSLLGLAEGPAALISRLNAVMVENSAPAKFVTAFYAELDLGSGTLNYVNAGHNPPLLFAAAGAGASLAAVPLGATGPVVGLLPGARFESRSVALSPGDLLALYTDGITECEDISENEFGMERLGSVFAGHSADAFDTLPQRLGERLQEFAAGAAPKDDSTFILLRRLRS